MNSVATQPFSLVYAGQGHTHYRVDPNTDSLEVLRRMLDSMALTDRAVFVETCRSVIKAAES